MSAARVTMKQAVRSFTIGASLLLMVGAVAAAIPTLPDPQPQVIHLRMVELPE